MNIRMSQTATSGDTQPYRVGFLLLNRFTLSALAAAIEPLRMANQLSGQRLYSWQLISASGERVCSSDGVELLVDTRTADMPFCDLVIVVGGVEVASNHSQAELRWLRTMARRPIIMGGLCTGAYVLAAAGLLDGYACSAHWDCLAALQEQFPRVHCNNQLYTLDRDRLTCTGGGVPMHMMLGFVRMRHTEELANNISHMLVMDRIRPKDEPQRMPIQRQLHANQPKLAEITQLMEANIEEPLELQELADYAGLSRRHMERLFLNHLGCTPSRYYMKLRLERARQLLKQTACPIVEIANMCGFVSAPHFSRCYRKYMGKSPRSERSGLAEIPQLNSATNMPTALVTPRLKPSTASL